MNVLAAFVLTAPSPLVGEGWGGGSRGDVSEQTVAHAGMLTHDLTTPTPDPSPQGGGES
jgi:hypothetical protein